MGVDPLADVGHGRVDEVAGRPGRRRRRRCRARSCAGRRCRAACGRPRDGTGCRTGCAARRRPARRTASSRSGPWRWKPSGRREIESPWLIQTGCSRSMPVNSGVVRGDADAGRAVLAVVERDDVATELVGHQLGAVADAEDRDPARPDRRVRPRGARVVDRVRAARQDDRPGAAPLELGVRRVVRQQLRVDVELADPTGDQLGELAAEIEDDDGLAVHRVAGAGLILARSLGGRCLERGLEIGLDLGVVRGEDPVARVRRLAVDRSCRAAVARRARWRGPAVPPRPPRRRRLGRRLRQSALRWPVPCGPVYPAGTWLPGPGDEAGRWSAAGGPRSAAVAHRLGRHREVALELGGHVGGRRRLGDRGAHVDQPAVALERARSRTARDASAGGGGRAPGRTSSGRPSTGSGRGSGGAGRRRGRPPGRSGGVAGRRRRRHRTGRRAPRRRASRRHGRTGIWCRAASSRTGG